MERSVLELRMRMLGTYMQELCQSNVVQSHHGLRELLMNFLEQGEYDRVTSGGPISNTVQLSKILFELVCLSLRSVLDRYHRESAEIRHEDYQKHAGTAY